MCHMDGRVGSSGRVGSRGLKCPDVVVVDDDMVVEVRMNEGPSGVGDRVSLEASRRTCAVTLLLPEKSWNLPRIPSFTLCYQSSSSG